MKKYLNNILISLVCLLSLSGVKIVSARIVINEVMYDPKGADSKGDEWIEFYNTGADEIDMTWWELGDEDGNWYTFPNFVLKPGRYVVVHYNSKNTPADNTTTDLYTGVADKWTNTEDQVSLYRSSIHDASTIIDFVTYCSDNMYTIPNSDDDIAVQAEIWTNDTYIDTFSLKEDDSFGLSPNGIDTNEVTNWSIFKNSTPGAPNLSTLPPSTCIIINEVGFKEDDSEDWIELYCKDDGNGGKGIDIGDCYLERDGCTIIKTISPMTIIKTGEYLVLHKGDPSRDEKNSDLDGIIDLFAHSTALVSTDSQVVFYDAVGNIEDAICWANYDDNWSKGEKVDVLVKANQWIIAGEKAEESDCVNTSSVNDKESIARINTVDTNSKNDWQVDPTPTMGKDNREIPVRANISKIEVSKSPFEPIREITEISFVLAVESSVNVIIYDIRGREIKTLIDRENLLYGKNKVTWDGKDRENRVVPIGVYICYIEAINSISKSADAGKIVIIVAKKLSGGKIGVRPKGS
ncbi:MAG: lamin tail domain-containing protein [bacterium]